VANTNRPIWSSPSVSYGHATNVQTTKGNTTTQVAILMGFVGEDCDVSALTEQDQEAFTRARLVGGIKYTRDGEIKETKAVRARAVQANLITLHSMLRWATTVRVQHGQRLLNKHPLAGVAPIRERTQFQKPWSTNCVNSNADY
jgi:hypothetical protein